MGKAKHAEARANDPERVVQLGKYIESLGGSAALVAKYTCELMVKRVPAGTENDCIYHANDGSGKKFPSVPQVARHLGFRVPKQAKNGTS